MAVKIIGLKEVLGKIDFTLRKKLVEDGLLDDIAKFVVNRIQSFTRSGKSISGKQAKKLKKLSKSYIEMRQGAVKFRTLKSGEVIAIPEPDEKLKEVDKEFFRPDLSNLTFTGQMLRAIKYVTNKAKATITIDVAATSRSGKYESLTNKKVAEYAKENGRPFLGLDDLGIKRIKRDVLKKLRDELRKSRFRK